MAAGFSESYIRLWSLKGEKLKGLRSDISPESVRDCKGVTLRCSVNLINLLISHIGFTPAGTRGEHHSKINWT